MASRTRIDATLVANTSWLRAILWAFTFALRQEAVELLQKDNLPLMVFDDPQATFDNEHRHRWALHVASLQSKSEPVQVILATYDELFLEALKIRGLVGREAMVAAAGPELGHVGIFEGSSLERKWEEAEKLKTPQAGRDYLSAMRVYLEGLLRLLLRAKGAEVQKFVVGDCREKIEQLSTQRVPPWDRAEFRKLASVLNKNATEVKFIEMAHHASGATHGMEEARTAEVYWRKKIRPALELCFKIHREYLVLHGGLSVIHASKSSIVLPDGLGSRVAQIPLRVWGRAAALSDGRMADGCVDVDLYAESSQKKITLEPFEGSRWRLRRMRSVYGNSIDFRLQQIDA
jgi:hypothetical protein